MNCPLGHGPLRTETHDGIEVDACPACGGEWLDHEEFPAIEAVAMRDEDVRKGMIEYMPRESERACPRCDGPMHEFDYRGNPLQLDACAAGHGYWLDGGEEARVKELIRQRARDLHRAASAESSFADFLSSLRGQLGGRRRLR
jgi:Zn-finger nucleic acid-binding protein